MKCRVIAVACVVVSGIILAGCGSSDNGGAVSAPDAAPGKTVEVKAIDFAFEPTAIELKAGEDVQFTITNGGKVEHNLTVEVLNVNQDVEAGKTAKAPATAALKAGTYQYHCEYHPTQMKGTITVT